MITLTMALLKPADRNVKEITSIQKNVATDQDLKVKTTSVWYILWEVFLNAIVLAIFLAMCFVVIWIIKVANDWTWPDTYRNSLEALKTMGSYVMLKVPHRPRNLRKLATERRCPKCKVASETAFQFGKCPVCDANFEN